MYQLCKKKIINNLDKCIFIECEYCKKEHKFNSSCKIIENYNFNNFIFDIVIEENTKKIGYIQLSNSLKIRKDSLAYIYLKHNPALLCEIKVDQNFEKTKEGNIKFTSDIIDYMCFECTNLMNKWSNGRKNLGLKSKKELFDMACDSTFNECKCGITKINICKCSKPVIYDYFNNKRCKSCDKWLCRC